MGNPSRVLELDEAAAFAAAGTAAGALIYVASPRPVETEGAGPLLEALATRYGGRLSCGRLDRDKAPRFAHTYGLTDSPTLLLFRRGRVLHRLVGGPCLDPFAPALRSLIERSLEAA